MSTSNRGCRYDEDFKRSIVNLITAVEKRNAQLEEELIILKKAIAIFTPHSNND